MYSDFDTSRLLVMLEELNAAAAAFPEYVDRASVALPLVQQVAEKISRLPPLDYDFVLDALEYLVGQSTKLTPAADQFAAADFSGTLRTSGELQIAVAQGSPGIASEATTPQTAEMFVGFLARSLQSLGVPIREWRYYITFGLLLFLVTSITDTSLRDELALLSAGPIAKILASRPTHSK